MPTLLVIGKTETNRSGIRLAYKYSLQCVGQVLCCSLAVDQASGGVLEEVDEENLLSKVKVTVPWSLPDEEALCWRDEPIVQRHMDHLHLENTGTIHGYLNKMWIMVRIVFFVGNRDSPLKTTNSELFKNIYGSYCICCICTLMGHRIDLYNYNAPHI